MSVQQAQQQLDDAVKALGLEWAVRGPAEGDNNSLRRGAWTVKPLQGRRRKATQKERSALETAVMHMGYGSWTSSSFRHKSLVRFEALGVVE